MSVESTIFEEEVSEVIAAGKEPLRFHKDNPGEEDEGCFIDRQPALEAS